MKTIELNSKKYTFSFSTINEAKKFAEKNNGRTCTIVEKEDDNLEKYYEFAGYSDKGVADLREVDGSNLFYENINEWESKEQFMAEMNEEYYGSQFLEEIWDALVEKEEVIHTIDTIVDIEYLPEVDNFFFAVEF